MMRQAERNMPSPPPEQTLDVGELQLHVSRTAVVALAGIGRSFHFPQQRVHLLALEPAPGAHRAVAGHGGGHMHEAALARQRLVPLRHVLGEIAHECAGVDLAKERGGLAHGDRAGPERLDGKPVARSEEHTSELQSLAYLVCRLLLEKKKKQKIHNLDDKKKYNKKRTR